MATEEREKDPEGTKGFDFCNEPCPKCGGTCNQTGGTNHPLPHVCNWQFHKWPE